MTLSIISPRTKAAASDLELLRRVGMQDRQAFELLYVAYHRRLSRFLIRVAGRYNLVEEVINDTMFVVWQKGGANKIKMKSASISCNAMFILDK